MSEDPSLGEAAHGAYEQATGHQGWAWDEIGSKAQEAWEAAADAAVDLYETRNIEEFSRALRG